MAVSLGLLVVLQAVQVHLAEHREMLGQALASPGDKHLGPMVAANRHHLHRVTITKLPEACLEEARARVYLGRQIHKHQVHQVSLRPRSHFLELQRLRLRLLLLEASASEAMLRLHQLVSHLHSLSLARVQVLLHPSLSHKLQRQLPRPGACLAAGQLVEGYLALRRKILQHQHQASPLARNRLILSNRLRAGYSAQNLQRQHRAISLVRLNQLRAIRLQQAS